MDWSARSSRRTTTTATVRLITDGQSSVGARYGANGALAVLNGQGAGKPLDADLVPPNTTLTDGEQFVTSGLQGAIYPPGIPVASVVTAALGHRLLAGDGDLAAARRPPAPPLRVGGAVGPGHVTERSVARAVPAHRSRFEVGRCRS